VSNLLAKGMRVLITAQTDRALQEVRAKQIQALAVSVIGQSRSDMANLRIAVDNISAAPNSPTIWRRSPPTSLTSPRKNCSAGFLTASASSGSPRTREVISSRRCCWSPVPGPEDVAGEV